MMLGLPNKKACIGQLVTSSRVCGKYGHVAKEAVAPGCQRSHLMKAWASGPNNLDSSVPLGGFKLIQKGDVIRQKFLHVHKFP